MIWPTLSILIALAVAAIITTPDRPPERTHTYWCYVSARVEVQGEKFIWTGSLPCKFKTNHPVSI